MLNDFSTEYVDRSDDELLHLATDRASLTDEAAAALAAELRRRNLTQSDQTKYQRFAHHMEQREFRSRRRRIFGKRQFSWLELLSAFAAMGLISLAYVLLPNRYHLRPEWQDSAVLVMITAVVIAVGWRSLWRDSAFWMALVLSSTIQLAVAHTWVLRAGELSRGAGKLAAFLSFVLFFVIYGCIRLLRRNFYGEGSSESG
jgi:hypothetical protein